MTTHLSVIVNRGSPVDASEYRHTALFLKFTNNTTLLLHVTGASGFFEFQARPNENPTQNQEFLKKIDVANIRSQTGAVIESVITLTPVNNSDRSWNCQNWVGDALKRLSDQRFITDNAREQAIDAMVDVILDAPDEC